MKIAIVGCGKIGRSILGRLAREEHDIKVIDISATAVATCTDCYDVMGLVGNGATYSVQEEAGVSEADLLIAVTASDELNLLACLVAKKLGAKATIARVRNPEYSGQMKILRDELGLSMDINPELATAEEIARILRCPAASTLRSFAKGRAEMAYFTLKEEHPIQGMTLAEMRKHYSGNVLICGIQRGEEVIIPGGDFVLKPDDRILVVSSPKEIDNFFRKINKGYMGIREVMIAGGSRIAFYLAERIGKAGLHPIIIEMNENKCQVLAERFPDMTIVKGDAGNADLLKEEGLEKMDAFVALTGLDEQNIMLGLYASTCHVKKVITKVNHLVFPELLSEIKLDTVVSPQEITSDQIVTYVRAMQAGEGKAMETMYQLMGGRIEAMEFIVKDDSIIDQPLKNLPFKKQVLVTCVVHNGKTIIPDGNTIISKGDSIIVVTNDCRIKALGDILNK